jgi:hypothetical protein
VDVIRNNERLPVTLHPWEVEEICEALMELDGILSDAGYDVDSSPIEGIRRALDILGYLPVKDDDDEDDT